jgi:hypothetical protein
MKRKGKEGKRKFQGYQRRFHREVSVSDLGRASCIAAYTSFSWEPKITEGKGPNKTSRLYRVPASCKCIQIPAPDPAMWCCGRWKRKKSRDDSELCERPLESVSRRGIIDQIPRNPKERLLWRQKKYIKKIKKSTREGIFLRLVRNTVPDAINADMPCPWWMIVLCRCEI